MTTTARPTQPHAELELSAPSGAEAAHSAELISYKCRAYNVHIREADEEHSEILQYQHKARS